MERTGGAMLETGVVALVLLMEALVLPEGTRAYANPKSRIKGADFCWSDYCYRQWNLNRERRLARWQGLLSQFRVTAQQPDNW